jgi:hypothetical protein
MPLAPSISPAAQDAAANAVVLLVDAGPSAGRLRIYSGTLPATAGAALTSQTLLADLAMSDPAFGAASGGVAVAGPIAPDTTADATGIASFFRCGSWDGVTFTPVFQGSCGTSASDLVLSSTSLTAGGTVAVASLTYTYLAS